MRRDRGKTPKEGIGRALVKKNQLTRETRRRDGRIATSNYHIEDDHEIIQQNKLESIMERNALDEFLTNAIMEEQDFSAQKTNVVMVGGSTVVTVKQKAINEQLDYEHIRIPRRPHWSHEMAADELQRLERESFLAWRRELAQYEEASVDKHSTPFEKNLEVWKQLWRVAERSHVVVQIVDARNPLLFYCKDVFTLAHELDPKKRCILVINKSDFLTREARVQWGKYFESQNIDFVFWSAKTEKDEQQEHLDRVNALLAAKERRRLAREAAEKKKEEQLQKSKPINPFALLDAFDEEEEDEDGEAQTKDKSTGDSDADYDEDDEFDEDDDEDEEITLDYETKIHAKDKYDIYGRQQLIDRLKSLADPTYVQETAQFSAKQRAARGMQPDPEASRINIGLLGFPNVGKSSTINALFGVKKVSVAATPGHTKHFQTLALDSETTLCDCPGLVFPTFVHSKHTLVVNGVIPIDTLRDFTGPIEVLCQKIPRSQISQAYGIEIPGWKTLDATTLLSSYCKMRSLYKQAGTYDEARAARIFLKDYVNGKLLHCQCPPNLTPEQRKQFYNSYRAMFMNVDEEGHAQRDFAPSLQVLADEKAQADAAATAAKTKKLESKDIDLDFLFETEQMTNSVEGLLNKHQKIASPAQQESVNDVIDIQISRTKFTHFTPDVDGIKIKENKSYRENIADLESTDLTKKQARRLRKNLIKGKKTISDGGATKVQSTASRKAGGKL